MKRLSARRGIRRTPSAPPLRGLPRVWTWTQSTAVAITLIVCAAHRWMTPLPPAVLALCFLTLCAVHLQWVTACAYAGATTGWIRHHPVIESRLRLRIFLIVGGALGLLGLSGLGIGGQGRQWAAATFILALAFADAVVRGLVLKPGVAQTASAP